MNADLLTQQAQVMYLIREGLWKNAQSLCQKIYQRNQDPFFQFWKAFCLYKSASVNEAINELTLIRNKREFQFATSAALIFYSQQQRGVDRETIELCRQMQNEGRKSPNDRAFATTMHFYLLVDEGKKAKEVTTLLSSNQPNNILSKAWYELLQMEEPVDNNKVLDIFLKAGDEFNQKPLEYLLGLSKACEQCRKFQQSLDAINEIQIVYKDFQFADVEKIRLSMLIQDWEMYQDMLGKILYNDPSNILGLKAQAYFQLARVGDLKEATESIEALFQAIQTQEEDNLQLILSVSQLVSRISGRNSQVLALTIGALQRIRKTQPLSADLCLELAIETMMLEDFDKSYQLFQEAAALDEGRIESLTGMIQCKILQNVIDDAEKQLEFVQEVQVSVGRTSEMAFLQALLEAKKTAGSETPQCQQLIDEALKLHIQVSRTSIPDFNFITRFNPDHLFTLAQLYLRNLSLNNMLAGKENPSSGIGKGTKLLETITKYVPGMSNAHLLMATGKMAVGDPQSALKAINKVLEGDPRNEDGYILQSLISIRTGQLSMALSSLNQAISNNFSIRENPLFMLIKGEIEYRTDDLKNATQTLETVYEYVAGRQKGKVKLSRSKILQFTEKDRCQVFILLAKCYAKSKKEKEARQIMGKAIQEYAGSPQEGQIMLANSEVSIESGDIKKAINILKAVTNTQANFQTSRIILADVYLKYLKDRRNYTKCYLELIEAAPTYENYKLLGDALLKINEPLEAVQYYQKAKELKEQENYNKEVKDKSLDPELTRTIGMALSLTYNYQQAIQFYENALKANDNQLELIVDLAELYVKINNLKAAETLLVWEKFVTDEYAAPPLSQLKINSKAFVLIAKIVTKNQQIIFNQAQKLDNQKQQTALLAESQKLVDKIRQAYDAAVQAQKDAIERSKSESGDVAAEKECLGKLYYEQAKYFFNQEKNFKAAHDCLEDGAKFIPTNENLLQLQAETLYQLQDKLACEQKLKMLQKVNPKNDYASMMLSELILQQDDSERQIQEFVQGLLEKPNQFGTLSKVIEWYRRQNRLQETWDIIEKITKANKNPNEPGLCFCRGLYYKYRLQPKEAMIQFNYAKKHSQYVEESLTHMIDLYLNPELDLFYSISDKQAKLIHADNLRACEQLLRELQNRGSAQRYTVMQAYVIQLSPNQKSVELAGLMLTQLLKQNQNCIPAMVALAINKFLSDKQTEGKNLLKMLYTKTATSGWEAEELERAFLLHADSFIAIQKYDQAEEVLRKCLKINKSCCKAEEFIGLIKEKEQSYIDAANSYEKAFQLSNQKNSTMGFKLAFNYLKAKRYVECINICKIILETNPNYPKLQTEILSKAIQALKSA